MRERGLDGRRGKLTEGKETKEEGSNLREDGLIKPDPKVWLLCMCHIEVSQKGPRN